MNKNRKMKLEEKGIQTGKYFSLEIPEGLKPGSKINILVTEDNAVISNIDDMEKNILKDGYVRNTKLYRRFVMAQMFKMLKIGYTEALNQLTYDYTFKTLIEEIHVLSKLQKRDAEAFYERVQFFNSDVAICVCQHYMEQLKIFLDSLPDKKCKGILYKKVKSVGNVFNEDIERKILRPKFDMITKVKMNSSNYEALYYNLKHFWDTRIPLPQQTSKSPAWVDAYKGAGAFYTCKNLIMYHNCYVLDQDHFLNRDASLRELYQKVVSYKGEYYRLLAYMKKLISDNNFSFDERMVELAENK